MNRSDSGSSLNGMSESKRSPDGTQKENSDTGMRSSQLMQLFEEQLKDIYWAERALTKAIPAMIQNATSPELIEALEDHLDETEEQVERIEQVFEILGKKAIAKKCEAMEGLINEAEDIINDSETGAMCDAGIISAGQKIEHYEIATYGTLRQFAETLGLEDAAALLQTTLDEEKAADEKLTAIAIAAVNIRANENDEESEEESDTKYRR